MKQKYFYSHLVELDWLLSELDSLDLTKEEKRELVDLAHTQVHQTVMDTILSHLDGNDKKRFLELVALGEDKKIWNHLNEKVVKIEDKIKVAAAQIKKELKEDIVKIKA